MSTIISVTAQDTDTAIGALRRDGVVHIKSLYPAETLRAAAEILGSQHPEFANLGEGKPGNDTGPGRFIAPVLITRALHALGLFEHDFLKPVADALLGPDHVVEAFGMMMSAVGSVEQKTHRDGLALFPESGVDSILPPSSLVVLIPLVDVPPEGGATAFRLGSHRMSAADASHDGTVLPPLALGGRAGVGLPDRALRPFEHIRSRPAGPAFYPQSPVLVRSLELWRR